MPTPTRAELAKRLDEAQNPAPKPKLEESAEGVMAYLMQDFEAESAEDVMSILGDACSSYERNDWFTMLKGAYEAGAKSSGAETRDTSGDSAPMTGDETDPDIQPFEGDLGKKLTELGATPTNKGGKITAIRVDAEGHPDADQWGSRELSPEELRALGIDPSNIGSIEPHPEGSDRGGYVPTLPDYTIYDEMAGEWF